MARVVISDEQLHKIQDITLGMLLEMDRICRKHNLKYSLAYGTLLGAVRHKGFIPWDDDVDVWMPRKDFINFREACGKELDSKYFYQSHETDKNYYLLFDKIRANGTVFKEEYYDKYDIHHGVYIDIFPIDNIPDSLFTDKMRIFSYEFYRIGVQTKYLRASARKGKKKVMAYILRFFYRPFSLEFLFCHAEKIAKKYADMECDKVSNIFDPDKSHVFKATSFKNYIELEFCGHSMMICSDYKEILRARYGNYIELPPEKERIPHHYLSELQVCKF